MAIWKGERRQIYCPITFQQENSGLNDSYGLTLLSLGLSRKVVQGRILVWVREGTHKLGNKMQILTRFSLLLLLAPEHGPHWGQQEVFRVPVDRLLEGAKAI